MVAAWLNNKMDITKRANPNNQGICVTICSIDPFNSVILPAINVSPIQAIPKIATTACMPAEKTEPCAALIPSVFVNNKMKAEAVNINTSIICDICIETFSVPTVKTGRRDSIEPKITIAIVARTNIATDKAAFFWFSTPFVS